MQTIVGIMLAVTGLLSLILIWIVEGAFKRKAPFGEAADYVIGLVFGVGIAALDYFVFIPAILGTAPEWFRLAGSASEGTTGAWLILWIIRQIARPPLKDDEAA